MRTKKKPAVRPTTTKYMERFNDLTIHLEKTDLVLEDETDERGYIRLPRTGLIGHNVTAIMGIIKPVDDTITVSKCIPIFTCKVMSGNFVSSLSAEFGDREVTLIIHDVPV